MWNIIKGFGQMVVKTGKSFGEDQCTRMAAALSYFTVFSIGPIMVLLIFLLQRFFGMEAAEGQVYGQIRQFVGHDAAKQIQEIIANSWLNNKSGFALVTSSILLVFTATGVFTEIQSSINTIWRLKAKPKKGWVKMIINRLLSFSMLISLGFILLVSLVLDTALEMVSTRFLSSFPEFNTFILMVLKQVLLFIATTFMFMIIFKVLPDATVKWKHVLGGSIATAILFMAGKIGIGLYLENSNVKSTYGAAGSVMIILLWVYYSAIILYFGAEFTRHFTQWRGDNIYPNQYAVWVKTEEVEFKGKQQEEPEVTGLEEAKKLADEGKGVPSMEERKQELPDKEKE